PRVPHHRAPHTLVDYRLRAGACSPCRGAGVSKSTVRPADTPPHPVTGCGVVVRCEGVIASCPFPCPPTRPPPAPTSTPTSAPGMPACVPRASCGACCTSSTPPPPKPPPHEPSPPPTPTASPNPSPVTAFSCQVWRRRGSRGGSAVTSPRT